MPTEVFFIIVIEWREVCANKDFAGIGKTGASPPIILKL